MVFYLLAGILIGAIITLIIVKLRNDGTLVVYIPGYIEEPPYLSCELNKQVEDICAKRAVRFKVEVRCLDSQK